MECKPALLQTASTIRCCRPWYRSTMAYSAEPIRGCVFTGDGVTMETIGGEGDGYRFKIGGDHIDADMLRDGNDLNMPEGKGIGGVFEAIVSVAAKVAVGVDIPWAPVNPRADFCHYKFGDWRYFVVRFGGHRDLFRAIAYNATTKVMKRSADLRTTIGGHNLGHVCADGYIVIMKDSIPIASMKFSKDAQTWAVEPSWK
jgi:hypothetical protein